MVSRSLPMEKFRYTICPLSERSITVQFEFQTSEKSLQHVIDFQREFQRNLFVGFVEMVPTYTALAIYFDPFLVMQSELFGETPLQKVSTHLGTIQPKENLADKNERWFQIPVCYDLEFGLDLVELSDLLSISVEEIIQLHHELPYTIFMVGFVPGFPYMGVTHPKLECLRKQNPRVRIPSGSVGIALNQTGIYPLETPGGWQIIGRTPLKLFSTENNPPALFRQGDRVKFERISRGEFNQLIKA